MSLQERVAAVFQGARIDRIDFRLEAVQVSPQRLRAVGEAIRQGRITVAVSDTGSLLAAAYTPHRNRMTLGNANVPNTFTGQATILHEGVHALVDMYRVSIPVLVDEVAAYLAEVIYWRAGHHWMRGGTAEMRIYNAADQIAQAHDLYSRTAYRSIPEDQRTSGLGVPD